MKEVQLAVFKCLRIAVLLSFLTLRLLAAEPIHVEEVQKAYAANNRDEQPIVSWMLGGLAKFLLYPDGTLMTFDRDSESRLAVAHLSPQTLEKALKTLSDQEGFWSLESRYILVKMTDQWENTITVNIPGKREMKVMVYGDLKGYKNPRIKFENPPPAFLDFIETLSKITPRDTKPWDPGYVEILWCNYNYAPDPSIEWPKEWPGLSSPLTRSINGGVVKYITCFPSSRLDELNSFLKQRKERGAVLVDGKKLSACCRWPLRGEKKWTSWQR